jgi:hypothetical protein
MILFRHGQIFDTSIAARVLARKDCVPPADVRETVIEEAQCGEWVVGLYMYHTVDAQEPNPHVRGFGGRIFVFAQARRVGAGERIVDALPLDYNWLFQDTARDLDACLKEAVRPSTRLPSPELWRLATERGGWHTGTYKTHLQQRCSSASTRTAPAFVHGIEG